MRSIHLGQQDDVLRCIASWKVRPSRRAPPYLASLRPAGNQASRLRPAQPAHLGQKSTYNTALTFAQPSILLGSQEPFDETIDGSFPFHRQCQLPAAVDELLHLGQGQLL